MRASILLMEENFKPPSMLEQDVSVSSLLGQIQLDLSPAPDIWETLKQLDARLTILELSFARQRHLGRATICQECLPA